VVDDRCDGAVGGGYGGVDDIDAVFVGEGCVGAFPGGDAAATTTKGNLCVGCPEGAEAWVGG
jgi:hypothetical protein